MAKVNVTLQHLYNPRFRDATFAVQPPLLNEIPQNRAPIRRLSWKPTELRCSYDQLAETIRSSSLPEAVFFLDSSFVGRSEIPSVVWDALLTRTIGITPLIRQEFRPLRNNPFSNRRFAEMFARADREGHPNFLFIDPCAWPVAIQAVAQRYINLLGYRKRIGDMIQTSLAKCAPTEAVTTEQITREMQKLVRNRGLVIAEKGIEDRNKPNFFADEELVVLAIIHAMHTGRESSILTRDADALEQFYKCLYLMDTDYRGALTDESYTANPDNHLPCDLERAQWLTDLYRDEDCTLFDLPAHFTEWVLPENPDWVVVYCKRIADSEGHLRLDALAFNTERQMLEQLQMRDETSFTTRLCVSPPFASYFGGKALRGKEKLTSNADGAGSYVDWHYAIMEVEHFKSVKISDNAAPQAGVSLANFFLDDRTKLSKQPHWMNFGIDEVCAAIEYADPASDIFIDAAFAMSPAAEVLSSAILKRGLITTTHIADSFGSESDRFVLPKAIRNRAKNVTLCDTSDAFPHTWGYGYYLGLLAFRKLFYRVIINNVERDYGRTPPNTEWPLIVEHYSGARGRRLAKAGERRASDPTLFFGDELLIQAFIASIYNGTNCVILTSDPLLMEQFIKLGSLMIQHYYAYAMGRNIIEHPENHPVDQLTSPSGYGVNYRVPANFASDSLPLRPYLLNIHLWTIDLNSTAGLRLATVTFCAERPMFRMLEIKGASGGRNLLLADDVNVRLARTPEGEPSVLFSKEQRVRVGSNNFPDDPRLDLRIPSVPRMDLAAVAANPEEIEGLWQ